MIFEGDSLNVAQGFHNFSNNQSYFGKVFADSNHLSSCFNSFSLSHVKCSANMMAHFLANFFLSSSNTVLIDECPPCIVPYVGAD